MDDALPSQTTARTRLVWALALAALSASTFAAVELHGRASRVHVAAPPGSPAGAAMVADAADALRVWRAAGVHGRRLVVLSGQWARPRSPEERAGDRGASGEANPTARDALYLAAVQGIARRIDVVMPPDAFAARLREVERRPELVLEERAFRVTHRAFERRFSTPDGFTAPDEPVLVLVEPSWFGRGAPPDPLAWLASRGAGWDLALLAVDDPGSTEPQRAAATAFGGARALTLVGAAP